MSRPVRLQRSTQNARSRSMSLTERIQSVLKQAGYVPTPETIQEESVIRTQLNCDSKLIKPTPVSKLTRGAQQLTCTQSTFDTIDTCYTFYDPNTMSSFSNDSKLKNSQWSAKPRVNIDRQRDPKQTSYYQQFLSFEATMAGKKPTSYREKLKQKSIAASKTKLVIEPTHSFTNEFIEPTDSVSAQSPNSIKLLTHENFRSEFQGNTVPNTPISKHKRNLSFTGCENDQPNVTKEPTSTDRIRSHLIVTDVEFKRHSYTNPVTPKSRMSPRETGSKELLAVLKRKYGEAVLEVTPIHLPLESPEVVLFCKGNRIQAFSVKSVRS